MNRLLLLRIATTACLLACASRVLAGMPAPIGDDTVEAVTATGLQEFAIERLQNISFFLVGFLLSALLIQALWNYLRRDWTFLPRLTYGKAVGVVFLWGLLFILVLTMISGARELMTPGAWQKQGLTYRLKETPAPADTQPPEDRRYEQLVRLRAALWKWAKENDGYFPDDVAARLNGSKLGQVPDQPGLSYLYMQGLQLGEENVVLVYEPDVFESGRWVLFANGDIRMLK